MHARLLLHLSLLYDDGPIRVYFLVATRLSCIHVTSPHLNTSCPVEVGRWVGERIGVI